MSFLKGLPAVVLVMAVSGLVGCGGSGHKTEEAGLTVCTPAEASVGSTVTCESGKLEDGSTLFVGNKPVDFTYNAEALTVSFQVPAVLPGTAKITSQSGDTGVRVIDSSFKVIAKPSTTPTAPAGDAPVAANDGDVILPSGGTPPPSYVPSDVPSVENPSNPAPETPEVPAGPAQIQTFNVDKAAGAALSTYRVSWQIAGAKAAYLWGNALNRTDGDNALAEAARCGLTSDGRYLAVNSDGNKLIEGSPNYTKYKNYAQGVLCNGTDGNPSNDCQGAPEPATAETPASEEGGEAPSQVLTLNPSLLAGVSKAVSNVLLDANPACRIDLTAFSGEFFTRGLAKNGKICLVIQGSDDTWTAECRGADAPKAALVASDGNVTLSTQKPTVVLDFNYVNAVEAPVAEGCTTLSPSQPGPAGGGHYRAECPIKKETMTINVKLQGLGKSNASKRSYRVDFAKPTTEMKLYGVSLLSNQEGEMKLQYTASRAYTITDLKSGIVISEQGATCPWVNGIRLYGQYVIDGQKVLHPGFKKVEKAADAQGVVTVYRDAYNYFWSFGAIDFDGFPAPSNVVGPEQTSEFSTEVSVIEGSFQNECTKKAQWVLQEDRESDDQLWVALGALITCESDLSCYKQWIKLTYGGSHTVGFALNATNTQSIDVTCKSTLMENKTVKTLHIGGAAGYQAPVVQFTDAAPVIQCDVFYEGTGGKSGKLQTSHSCIGYDYGPLSLADVKSFLMGKGVPAEEFPF